MLSYRVLVGLARRDVMDKTSIQPKMAEAWALNPDQMLFTLRQHNAVETAIK